MNRQANYAATLVFYLDANDEDHVKHILDHIIDEQYLYKDRNESYQIVSIDPLNETDE